MRFPSTVIIFMNRFFENELKLKNKCWKTKNMIDISQSTNYMYSLVEQISMIMLEQV